MILRSTTPRMYAARVVSLRLPGCPAAGATRRGFLTGPTASPNQNRVFDNIRQPNDLHTLTLLSATSNRPLITLWSASWCSTCQVVKPLIKGLIEDERVGEAEGGLAFAEVELDSTLIGDLGVKYMIASIPTLLAFSRQEAQMDTKLVRPDLMKNEEYLRNWLLNEARRGGRAGGGGGGLLGGLFGRS
ncbi:hypothetical protein DM02DRAFT_612061 [Periconia macrospinosa]|uniref:Thioredoxin domain-containing protein n=1 Tax=Periconia macrospinosa TaxID=97972 RepID=A0A2V1DZT2_9PLEO|nr:hypothetical protein DM02DRAFT_612061 [Periconia macrospinosa]